MFPIINSLDITQYEGGNNMDFLNNLPPCLVWAKKLPKSKSCKKLQALQANSTEEKEKEKKDDEKKSSPTKRL
ncbi:hypothetical protein WDD9_006387 [Paenibacillus melissococcoides]|uniref:hypothetical protein n=1 Tax=Paenibacillus melissococcoides TaxID=2912268 RepID=UPI0021C2A6EF|nr:hypothetical protein [Paenibacillus melissococcoides]CAH8721633.1 hypothetical protein WDD9_006387 [Paenibacillus melissococcoides]